jgi:hypothetical protein
MDERYERSADMRLLEFEREARGIPRRIISSTSYTDYDALDAFKDDDDSAGESGPILVATLDAQPREGLIAGALVTVAISILNEGDTAASDARLSLPLPVNTAYRPDSLMIDGATGADAVAYDLFANGAAVGTIEPGGKRTIAIKLGVEAGTSEIRLVPQLTATSSAILGLRAMRLSRSSAAASEAAIERPFYESIDADEIDADADATLAIEPTISVLQPVEFPKIPQPAEVPKTAEPVASPKAPEPIADPTMVEPAASPKTMEPAASLKTMEPAASLKTMEPAASLTNVEPAAAQKNVEPATSAKTPAPAQEHPVEVAALPALVPIAAAPAPAAPIAAASEEISRKSKSSEAAPRKAITKRGSDSKQKPPRAKAKSAGKAKAETPKLVVTKGIDAAAPAQRAAKDVAPRPKLEVVRSNDDRLSITARGGPILTVQIDRKRLMTLGGLFSGPSFGMIAHYLVLNALAAKDPLPGDTADGSIATFIAEQEQLLSRALISARLGKTLSPESISANLPAFGSALASFADERKIDMLPPGQTLLFRSFARNEIAFLERTLSNDNAFPFMRAAHLFVGLCANDAAIVDSRSRRNVAVALSAYTALATAEISRIFLRAKLRREPAIFKATDPAFDEAARTVLTALSRSIS